MLEAGVDVNIRNVQNTIPLHVALARGAKSCVELLLSAGANCNLQVCYSDVDLHHDIWHMNLYLISFFKDSMISIWKTILMKAKMI